MFCINCGSSNKDDAKFCVNCAESLGEVQIEERPSRPTVLKDVCRLGRVDFLGSFCDFSFNQFVSPKTMKFLYGLSILTAALTGLLLVVVGFKASILLGILCLLIGAPLLFLLMVISARVLLEMILVSLRIADRMENIEMTKMGMPTGEEKSESRDSIQWNI